MLGLGKETDRETFDDMTQRLLLPPDDPKHLNQDEITAAVGARQLSQAHAGFLARQLGPKGMTEGTKMLWNGTLGQIKDTLNPDGTDVGSAAAMKARAYLQQQFEDGMRRGETSHDLLSPEGKSYIFKGGFDQFTAKGAEAIAPIQARQPSASAQKAAGSAVDLALQITALGRHNDPDTLNEILADDPRTKALNVDVRNQAWCATLVNSVLGQVGLKGTGSQLASSFKNWGFAVDAANIQKGDVFYGTAEGYTGHVGLTTGLTRLQAGQLQVQVVSSHLAGKPENNGGIEWRSARGLLFRRAQASLEEIAKNAENPAWYARAWRAGASVVQHLRED